METPPQPSVHHQFELMLRIERSYRCLEPSVDTPAPQQACASASKVVDAAEAAADSN